MIQPSKMAGKGATPVGFSGFSGMPWWLKWLTPIIVIFVILMVLVGPGPCACLFPGGGETKETLVNGAIPKAKWGNLEGALADLDSALEMDPECTAALNNRGMVKLHMKYYNDAVEDFERAIELGTRLTQVYNNCGVARLQLKDYNGAIRDFTESIRLQNDQELAYCNRGIAYERKGMLKEAAEDFHAATSLRRNDPVPYFCYARVLGKQGDKNGMYEKLSKVIELAPANAEVLKEDEDFKAYRDDPEFKKLVGSAEPPIPVDPPPNENETGK